MAKQTIDIGSAANDGTGDDLRTGAGKINDNFTELYTDVAALQAATGTSITGIGFDSGRIVFEGATDDTNETTFQVEDPTKDNTITLPDSSGTVALITDIKKEIDSAYISLLTGTAFDSSSTLVIVQANSIDSADAITLVDSAYVKARMRMDSFDGDFIPGLDSTYDLGSSSRRWKDLYLSGQTLDLGGQTIKNLGSQFVFSQEVSTGENNMSVDSGQGFFVNTYANISTGHRTGSYAVQPNSLKIEGNTLQFATVDGIPAANFITNQNILNFESAGAIGLPRNTAAEMATVAGRSGFQTGSIAYQDDSNQFQFHDDQGWFSIKRNMLDSADAQGLVDSGYVRARAVELDLRNYTVATVPSGQAGKMIFVTDGNSGLPCLAVFDSAGGNYLRVALGSPIST